jgi:transposase
MMSRQDNPQTHPNLDAPIEVVADPSLSKQEKAKALEDLEQDARQLAIASSERLAITSAPPSACTIACINRPCVSTRTCRFLPLIFLPLTRNGKAPNKLYADAGYQGAEFQSAMKRVLAHLNVEIVKRSDQVKGFVVLPKRWIVERYLGLARPLPKIGQGLGMPQLQGACLLAPRLHPPHAAKAMQSHVMFADRL